MPQPSLIRKIQESLLAWYRANKRDLPWRKTRDPYAIWISEIMLQQTQVDTVIPFYKQWLKKFPNIRKLAQAREDDVLKTWEGLGYYSRARNLHRAAHEILKKYNGKVPETKEDILSLPGIGRYTAGAILSIAFNQPEPLVDGNVTRVLTRLFNIQENIDRKETQKSIWDKAALLVPFKFPGDFNQALMELGAVICIPGNPGCLLCPLNQICLGFKKANPALLPLKNSRPETEKFEGWIFLIENRGKFLIQKRPKGKVMGGLWEFPSLMHGKSEDPKTLVKKNLGMNTKSRETGAKITAAFTKYRGIYQLAHLETVRKNFKSKEEFAWAKPSDFTNYTFSAPSRKALQIKGWQ